MNILDLPQIAALLGGGMNPQAPQSNPQMGDPQSIFTRSPSPTSVPMPGPNGNVPTPDDIQVTAPPQSQYRQGLFAGQNGDKGPLRRGGTLANILGALGDAFLVQGGAAPAYANRMAQLRESEALKGFQADPANGIAQLTQVNPQAGIKLYGDQQDYNLKKQSADTSKRNSDLAYQDAIDGQVKAMLAGANEQSYPALRDWAMKRYANLGLTPSFDLPPVYDKDALSRIVNSDIPVKDQQTLADARANREAMLSFRRDALAEKATSDTARNANAAGRNGDYSRYVDAYTQGVGVRRDATNKMPDRSHWTQPQKGGNSAVSGFTTVVGPDGKKHFVPVMAK